MRGGFPVSEQLFRALLHLYPKPFRALYGQQMRLTFRDACRAAYRRNGAGGLLALWLPTLLDLFTSAIAERARQKEVAMSKERMMALAGPLTILVGSMWAMASVGEFVLLTGLAGPDTFWDAFWLYFVLLSLVPMLFALIGTRLRFRRAAGVPGRLGLALSMAGCAGMIVFVLASILLGIAAPKIDQGLWANYVIEVCFLSLMIGYALFGVDALRYKLLPRWNVSLLLAGSTVVFRWVPDWLGLTNYHPWQLAAYFLHLMVTGACWMLFGMAMMTIRKREWSHR